MHYLSASLRELSFILQPEGGRLFLTGQKSSPLLVHLVPFSPLEKFCPAIPTSQHPEKERVEFPWRIGLHKAKPLQRPLYHINVSHTNLFLLHYKQRKLTLCQYLFRTHLGRFTISYSTRSFPSFSKKRLLPNALPSITVMERSNQVQNRPLELFSGI